MLCVPRVQIRGTQVRLQPLLHRTDSSLVDNTQKSSIFLLGLSFRETPCLPGFAEVSEDHRSFSRTQGPGVSLWSYQSFFDLQSKHLPEGFPSLSSLSLKSL